MGASRPDPLIEANHSGPRPDGRSGDLLGDGYGSAMVLAELESFLSRPVAPTRRVALGALDLPVDPAPGFGGVLLGAIAARFAPELDPDHHDELVNLMDAVELGQRISQPRVRHRLQQDRVGLQRCSHRLVGEGERVGFEYDDELGTPAQHLLCAVYAVATVPSAVRPTVMSTVRKGFEWRGRSVEALLGHLAGTNQSLTPSAVADRSSASSTWQGPGTTDRCSR